MVKKIAAHIGIILLSLFCLYGIPYLNTDHFKRQISGDVDAVSAATTILAAPSGNYVVLINKALQFPNDKIEDWEMFFRGEETDLLFDDVTLAVAMGDTGGMDMARSYQSRLPENQMTLQTVDPIMLLSKADAGRVSFAVMSKEAADAYQAENAAQNPDMEVIEVQKKTDPSAETETETELIREDPSAETGTEASDRGTENEESGGVMP